MKLRAMLVGLAVAMCGAGASNGVHNAFSASDSLVAAYSFDGGSGTIVTDESGNGNNGALSGATWTTSGKNKSALTFDGVNDWVTVPDSASLDLAAGMTLEAWVRPTVIGQFRTVVAKERPGGIVYALHASEDTSRPVGQVDIGGERNAVGPSPLPRNAWSHLATTYDGTTVRLYVNGVLGGSSTIVGSMPASAGPLRLGGNSIWSEWFQGQLDDVRIYKRALTATEIQADMNIGVGTAPTAPAGDAQAPSAPGGLTVGGQTQTALTLTWAASNDNVGVSGYGVYRNGAAAGSSTAAVRSYTFTGLSCGTTYTLAVDAFDAAGNRSSRTSAPGTTTACAAPTPPPAPPQAGALVAAYSFDGGSGSTLADISGKGNAGSVSGPSWTTAGKNGGALTFDGVNDLVTVQDSDTLDLTTGMTLEAWVRPTTTASWRTVVTKEQSNNLVYGLFSNSDGAHPSSIVSIGSNLLQDIARGSSPLPTAAWTHVASTYDGSQLRLYINGSQSGSRAVTGAMSNSNKPLQIGGNKVWGEWFQGQIDDLRIYNRSLTQAELQADMNTPVGTAGPNPEPAPSPAPAPVPSPGDAEAPSTPGGLSISGQSQTSVTLTWNASTDNVGVTGYNAYRNTTLAGTTPTGTRTYSFNGLACGTSYTLGVEALDAAGNKSARATINGATSPCSTPAPTPTPTPTPAPAGTINVAPGGNLDAAYSQAQDGWVIQLAAGDYGIWRPSGGSKRVTIKGVSGTRFRQLHSQFDNIVFDGLDVDAGGIKTANGAVFESNGDNATFRNGRIGNVTDEKGALISGSNFTFDNVYFHDAVLRTPGVHMECLYAIVVPGFTIRNSTFHNCAVMDILFTYGDWWSPRPPAYGNVTIENNRFEASRDDNGACCHYYGLYVGNVAYPAPGTLNGWTIRNNWFEQQVAITPPVGTGNTFCGNTGNAGKTNWNNPC
jgi:chitodextrinase